MLRGLVGVAAAAAVVGSVVMRRWDRVAGKRVAELTRARASDEWKHEERTAELESDLEESRELRAKLEAKLRSKRTELAALRSEHAALLRRYATAETERASALEGRRRLAIEASAPAKALPAGNGNGSGSAQSAGPAGAVGGAAPAAPAPSPALYRRANAALARLAGDGSGVPAQRGTGNATGADGAVREEAEAAQGKPGAVDAQPRTAAEPQTPAPRHYPVPAAAAAAVVPYTPSARRAERTVGGFDFFGTKGVQEQVRAIENKDLADVVGEEAMALHRAEANAAAEADANAAAEAAANTEAEAEAAANAAADTEPGADAGAEAEAEAEVDERGIGEVIDLTAHDETEQLDMTDLRSAIS